LLYSNAFSDRKNITCHIKGACIWEKRQAQATEEEGRRQNYQNINERGNMKNKSFFPFSLFPIVSYTTLLNKSDQNFGKGRRAQGSGWRRFS